jgi:hypothetical protein
MAQKQGTLYRKNIIFDIFASIGYGGKPIKNSK